MAGRPSADFACTSIVHLSSSQPRGSCFLKQVHQMQIKGFCGDAGLDSVFCPASNLGLSHPAATLPQGGFMPQWD